MFFNFSKTRREIKSHIRDLEKIIKKLRPHTKQLNLKNSHSKSSRLFRQLLFRVTYTFLYEEKLYSYYGDMISKIYNNIQLKLEKRKFLNFFLNSVLLISVNSSLFRGVFFVRRNFLKTKMLSTIYIKLLERPFRLNM